MIEIEIDGVVVEAQEGETIIEVADRCGSYIPRFCYHERLSVAANCRMCLVEVDKVGKPLPACATPITAGMKVRTQSDKALSGQKDVMEFLLLNHPLDCPICDQGGECELQDLAMGYGSSHSALSIDKRAVHSDDLGSLIDTEMTRCIHCTRCVRFGEEVAGVRELGITERGEHSHIGTYLKHFVRSELSGNVIDLCPVGALTAKPSLYEARAWELRQHASIAVHDCLGSSVYLHTRSHNPHGSWAPVIRVVPREGEVNRVWLSDRDRFSYQGLHHAERLTHPRIKKRGVWHTVSWSEALSWLDKKVSAIIKADGSDAVAGLISPSATLEEMFVMQSVLREAGTPHIDHRHHLQDMRDQDLQPTIPLNEVTLDEVESLTTVFFIGSDARREQPMFNHRVRQAVLGGATVYSLNSRLLEWNYPVVSQVSAAVDQWVLKLGQLVKSLDKSFKLPGLDLPLDEEMKEMAQALKKGERLAIVMGPAVLSHPDASVLRYVISHLVGITGAVSITLTYGSNTAGAWLTGCVPHRMAGGKPLKKPGCSVNEWAHQDNLSCVFLHGVEVGSDTVSPGQLSKKLSDSTYVVAVTSYASPHMEGIADILLPLAPWGENEGTYINAWGHWQSTEAASSLKEDALPGWMIWKKLAESLSIEGVDYADVHEVKKAVIDVKAHKHEAATQSPTELLCQLPKDQLYREGLWSMYRVDPLVRRAAALQEAQYPEGFSIHMNSKTAKASGVVSGDLLDISQSGCTIKARLICDDSLSEGSLYLPLGSEGTEGMGGWLEPITIKRAAE